VNYEEYWLLDCNTVQFVDIPAFWSNIRPISSGSKIKKSKKRAEAELSLLPTLLVSCLGYFSTLNMVAIHPSKTSGSL
jgi:hypothetical protein